MEKIFCIGFSKTGTTSLEAALKLLGYHVCEGHYNNNHSHYLLSLFINEEYEEIDRIIEYYDVFCDLPWGGTDFYKYLSQKYPNAKFIHTTRDPEGWYMSFERMITQFDANLETAMDTFHNKGRYGVIYYIRKILKVDKLQNNKSVVIDYYIKLNADIISYFNESDYAYLHINLIGGDTWDVLCPFLNKPIPNLIFPHKNRMKTLDSVKPSSKRKQVKVLLKKIIKVIIS